MPDLRIRRFESVYRIPEGHLDPAGTSQALDRIAGQELPQVIDTRLPGLFADAGLPDAAEVAVRRLRARVRCRGGLPWERFAGAWGEAVSSAIIRVLRSRIGFGFDEEIAVFPDLMAAQIVYLAMLARGEPPRWWWAPILAGGGPLPSPAAVVEGWIDQAPQRAATALVQSAHMAPDSIGRLWSHDEADRLLAQWTAKAISRTGDLCGAAIDSVRDTTSPMPDSAAEPGEGGYASWPSSERALESDHSRLLALLARPHAHRALAGAGNAGARRLLARAFIAKDFPAALIANTARLDALIRQVLAISRPPSSRVTVRDRSDAAAGEARSDAAGGEAGSSDADDGSLANRATPEQPATYLDLKDLNVTNAPEGQGDPPRATGGANVATIRGDAVPRDRPRDGQETEDPRPSTRRPAGKERSHTELDEWNGLASQTLFSGARSFRVGCGGLLFLLRPVLRLPLVREHSGGALEARLTTLGRLVLGRVLGPLPPAARQRAFERERPLLQVFAGTERHLAQLDAPVPPGPVREDAETALDAILARIPGDIALASGPLRFTYAQLPDPFDEEMDRALAAVILRQGRLVMAPHRADLYLPLTSVAPAVRQLGWDIDPGWVPDLGRVIHFHYEDHE